MLSFFSNELTKNCEGVSRREFLQIGTLGLGGLTLSNLLALKAMAGSEGFLRDKAVVVLNLQGGPTHIETFDPKMTAPVEYRAMFGEVKTSLAGVTFGSHFPRLASLAHRMSVVRSFAHGSGSHGTAAQMVMAGNNPTGGNMGSLYASLAGTNSPVTGIPTSTVITPPAVGEQYKGFGASPARVTHLGTLSDTYKPFDPSSGGQIVDNMKLRMSGDRLGDRRSLLRQFDQLRHRLDGTGVLDGANEFQQQAFDVLVGGISDAFDITREDPSLIERYDTGMFPIPKHLQKKKTNVPGQSPVALGKQMLLARRLVEADCRFVTVTSAGWDMHGNAFGINDGMPLLGPAVDKAASAFLEDIEQRGLANKVLLVITGEFGRTPKINNKGGRDHWGNLCTLAFAGGGLNHGQVIGQSDRIAGTPNGDRVTLDNLLATVMHTLLDIGQLRLVAGVPSDINRALTAAQPIPQLIG